MRRIFSVVIFAAGLAGLLVALAVKGGLNEATGIATIAPVLMSILLWGWKRPAPGTLDSTPDQVELAKRKLAGQVLGQWRNEAEFRQLDDPAPIAVRWHLTASNLTDHAAHVASPESINRFSVRSDQAANLAASFRLLSRRRLVIIGEPGMGKTTLAVLLMRELLEHPEAGDPVPVMIPLGTFKPSREGFYDWLVKRLSLEYPTISSVDYGGTAVKDLVSSREILPVLDGLDEVPEALRPHVVEQLNLAGALPLIITCRTDEYKSTISSAAGDVITGAAVIESDTLRPSDVTRFIEAVIAPGAKQLKQWSTVLNDLASRNHTNLAAALATPLWLWLFRQVYVKPSSNPTELLDRAKFDSTDAIRNHLLDQLIPSMVAASESFWGRSNKSVFSRRHRWTAESVQKWLGYIAYQFPSRDIEWWHLRNSLSSKSINLTRALSGALIIFLAVSAPLLFAGAVSGLILGAAFGFIYLLILLTPGGLSGRPWSRVRFTAVIFKAGAISILSFWLIFCWVPDVFIAALAVGLVVMFAIGLSCWLGESSEPLRANMRIHRRLISLFKYIHMAENSVGSNVMLASGAVGAVSELASKNPNIVVGVAGGAIVGMAFWSLFVVGAGLLRWIQSPASQDDARSPRSTLNGDMQNFAIRVTVLGAPLAVLVWLAFWLADHNLRDGICIGISAGLLLALMAALGQPGDIYFCVSVRLWLSGRKLPLRLMCFFEDAHRMGLLRQVGPIYQFRHAALQDRLAKDYEERMRVW